MQQTAKLKLDEQKKMETKKYQTYFVHEETEETQCYISTCKKLKLHKHINLLQNVSPKLAVMWCLTEMPAQRNFLKLDKC